MAHAVFGHHMRSAPGGEGNCLAGIGRPDPHRPNAGYVIGRRPSPGRAGVGEMRRKRTEAVAHLLVRRGAEADSARLGERFEEVRFVPEMERFVYRRRRRDA